MKRQTNSIYAVTMTIIIAFASFFISWKMLVPNYQSNKLLLMRTEKEILAASAKRDSLTTAKNDIESLGDVYDQMFVAIPNDSAEPDILSEIEGMALAYKLSIPSIQISPIASATTVTSSDKNSSNLVGITFTANGDFEGLNKLTKSIENNLKLLTIKSMVISSADTEMSAAIQISAYKLPQVTTLTDPANEVLPDQSGEI